MSMGLVGWRLLGQLLRSFVEKWWLEDTFLRSSRQSLSSKGLGMSAGGVVGVVGMGEGKGLGQGVAVVALMEVLIIYQDGNSSGHAWQCPFSL